MKRALILNASALIVVHNHPSGDSKPSREDIEMTRALKAAATALEIVLHDHVVIGHGRHASFRSLGLLYRYRRPSSSSVSAARSNFPSMALRSNGGPHNFCRSGTGSAQNFAS